MPEVTTFWEDVPSGLLHVCDTKQSSADWFWLRVETPFHCHREKQQGFTTLHSAVSHSVNEVRLLLFKWWLARWLYRTQADACGSRAIEWFRLYLGRYFRLIAFYAMPEVTTFCEKCAIRFVPCLRHQAKPGWLAFATSGGLQSIATERSIRVSLRSTQLFLTVSMRLGSWPSNGNMLDGSTERRLTLAEVEPSNGFGGCLTDVGSHFRLIVFHAMPEVTTFWEEYAIRFAPYLQYQAKPGW